ncbi:acyl-CoA thioesterase II [Bradyrhizobium sp. CNPSo 4010]|uniref:Acyl-CoA thioesterase II n=1 Tax=Bradyrhizobium agreste TaxID=2751811 RepID=A0ABS0PGP2_9BRAD|nr:acyl-CoA thioesterase II [Bradyrhizobium agreste]MBH5396245.1 acyl-CoA thioesterase II [Bradyrhizobium agreste]
MSTTQTDLLAILDLDPIEPNLFRGNSPNAGVEPVFGGQLIGQAMRAASRTVEGRRAHSLHCYFIQPGDRRVPIIYKVEPLRDGKSYSTRRVIAIQRGDVICSVIVSFHIDEQSVFEHQDRIPDAPMPEALTAGELSKMPMYAKIPERIRRWYEPGCANSEGAIEVRPVDIGPYIGQKIDSGCIRFWIKPTAKLPDDPALHLCALAYASDWSLLDAVMARYGRTVFDGRMLAASLDHAIWFHRPFRADDWLLYVKDSPSSQGGRGIARGLIFKRDGTLVASVAQEAALRERR